MCVRCHSRPGMGDMVSDNAMDVAAAITGRDFGGETYHWTALLDSTTGQDSRAGFYEVFHHQVSIQVSITGRDFAGWNRDKC